jgi:hypothetical protein
MGKLIRRGAGGIETDLEVANSAQLLVPQNRRPDFTTGYFPVPANSSSTVITHNLQKAIEEMDVMVTAHVQGQGYFKLDYQEMVGTTGNQYGFAIKHVDGYNSFALMIMKNGLLAPTSAYTWDNVPPVTEIKIDIYLKKEQISIIQKQLAAQDGLQQRGDLSIPVIAANGNYSGHVDFPVPFSTVPFVTLTSRAVGGNLISHVVGNVTTAGFDFIIYNNGSVATGAFTYSWQAIAGSTTDLIDSGFVNRAWQDVPIIFASTVSNGPSSCDLKYNSILNMFKMKFDGTIITSYSYGMTIGTFISPVVRSLVQRGVVWIDVDSNIGRYAAGISIYPDGRIGVFVLNPSKYSGADTTFNNGKLYGHFICLAE